MISGDAECMRAVEKMRRVNRGREDRLHQPRSSVVEKGVRFYYDLMVQYKLKCSGGLL
jgi:hypothetical protein